MGRIKAYGPILLMALAAGFIWLVVTKTDDACIVVSQEQRLVPQADGSLLVVNTFRCPNGRVLSQ